ncbi:hypothetical protein DICVIV_11209 [Dictyocaulus viviparus]|uniref:Uncharacterized protein n=1 Tax=Dictyocaulus viviparus TaxID=29172 RepID=A0A0D8XGD0_DICVI|nr:hypothetical protein DICVIV_11209 [Dictyocaulus viviparus]
MHKFYRKQYREDDKIERLSGFMRTASSSLLVHRVPSSSWLKDAIEIFMIKLHSRTSYALWLHSQQLNIILLLLTFQYVNATSDQFISTEKTPFLIEKDIFSSDKLKQFSLSSSKEKEHDNSTTTSKKTPLTLKKDFYVKFGLTENAKESKPTKIISPAPELFDKVNGTKNHLRSKELEGSGLDGRISVTRTMISSYTTEIPKKNVFLSGFFGSKDLESASYNNTTTPPGFFVSTQPNKTKINEVNGMYEGILRRNTSSLAKKDLLTVTDPSDLTQAIEERSDFVKKMVNSSVARNLTNTIAFADLKKGKENVEHIIVKTTKSGVIFNGSRRGAVEGSTVAFSKKIKNAIQGIIREELPTTSHVCKELFRIYQRRWVPRLSVSMAVN